MPGSALHHLARVNGAWLPYLLAQRGMARIRRAASGSSRSPTGRVAVRRVPQNELSALQQKVRQHRDEFLEKWHAHFGRGA